MKKIRYDKIIRDKIPEIIEADGKSCTIEILSDERYAGMLDEKLIEECKEYQESKSLEELADIMEVIYAIAAAKGHSVEELEQVRVNKAEKRGGFEKRIFLKEVKEA